VQAEMAPEELARESLVRLDPGHRHQDREAASSVMGEMVMNQRCCERAPADILLDGFAVWKIEQAKYLPSLAVQIFFVPIDEVSEYLTVLGVDRSPMSLQGFGESKLGCIVEHGRTLTRRASEGKPHV
jgi:hypothetical protein